MIRKALIICDKIAAKIKNIYRNQRYEQKKKRKRRNQRNLITIILAFALCVIAIALYCIACGSLDDGTIWGDVTVNGVQIGGLKREEASLAVHSSYGKEYHNAALKVELGGKEYRMEVFPALAFNVSEVVSKAYDPGHGPWILRGFDWLATKK